MWQSGPGLGILFCPWVCCVVSALRKGCLVGSEFKAVCVKLSLMLSSMSTFRCIILTIPQSSNASHALASVEERFMMCDEAAILRDIVADLSKS
jgi:hypothetical protein